MAKRDPRVPPRRGIPFSDAMVLALRRGIKTQTRRLSRLSERRQPFAAGEELYVREAWRPAPLTLAQYRADGELRGWPARIRGEYERVTNDGGRQDRWRPPRFMFRALARTWLLVEDVRKEPLQDITPEEAFEEGSWTRHRNAGFAGLEDDEVLEAFREAWDELHGTPAAERAGQYAPWRLNPSVWVVRFRVLQPLELCVVCGEPLVPPDRDYCPPCEEA